MSALVDALRQATKLAARDERIIRDMRHELQEEQENVTYLEDVIDRMGHIIEDFSLGLPVAKTELEWAQRTVQQIIWGVVE